MESDSKVLQEKDNKKEIEKEEVSLKSFSCSKVLIASIKLFLKVYGIRVAYSLFKLFKSKNKFTIDKLVTSTFNLGNLRTGLFVSLLPLSYKYIKQLIETLFNLKDSAWITFVAGLLSSYISVCFEEKTNLVNYIILSVLARVAHSGIIILFKKLNIFQVTGKLWDFSVFFIAAFILIMINFLNPGFKPITKLLDTYSNYVNQGEKDEMKRMREVMRIV
jgi:hypothetical protein